MRYKIEVVIDCTSESRYLNILSQPTDMGLDLVISCDQWNVHGIDLCHDSAEALKVVPNSAIPLIPLPHPKLGLS